MSAPFHALGFQIERAFERQQHEAADLRGRGRARLDVRDFDHGRGWLLLPRRDAVRVAVRVPLAEVGASLLEADRLVFGHELAV